MDYTVEICNTLIGHRSVYEYSSLDGAKDRALREASRCKSFVRIDVHDAKGKVVFTIAGAAR